MTRIFLGWLFNFLERRHCLLDNRQKTLLDNRQKTLDSKQYIYHRYPFQYITIDSSTSDTKLARKPNSNFICPVVLPLQFTCCPTVNLWRPKALRLRASHYSGGSMSEICNSIAKIFFFKKWIPLTSEAIFWSRFWCRFRI